MLKRRIIPVLTFNGLALVKTKKFELPRMVGNPVQAARVYNSRGVDELVYLDIMASRNKRKFNEKLTADVIKECFMPVAIGGGISEIEDMKRLFRLGADKVVLRQSAFEAPDLVKEAVYQFGSQAIVVALDVVSTNDGYKVCAFNKEQSLASFITQMEELEVGEYLVTSIQHDGTMQGYDLKIINKVLSLCTKPVVAIGGAGMPDHVVELFTKTSVDAAGISSMFHFRQFTPFDVKKALSHAAIPVRL